MCKIIGQYMPHSMYHLYLSLYIYFCFLNLNNFVVVVLFSEYHLFFKFSFIFGCAWVSGIYSSKYFSFFKFLVALGLHCWAWAFFSCKEKELLVLVLGFLFAVASLGAKV